MLQANGGLTAPSAPQIGLASARRPRSVNRRQTSRGRKIERSVAENQRARASRNGGTTAPAVDPGYSRAPAHTAQRPNANAIGSAVQPDLGQQLSRRVASGAIDQQQAEQVAHDRALLEQVYGPNWRDRVFGGAGVVRGLREDVAAHGANEFGAKAKLGELTARRKRLLDKARERVAAE